MTHLIDYLESVIELQALSIIGTSYKLAPAGNLKEYLIHYSFYLTIYLIHYPQSLK